LTLGTFAHTRDMEVAMDVSRMVELRRFEEEFAVYGCVFFENGERRFLVSGNEERIWEFENQQEYHNTYPFPMQKCSYKTTVPAGMEDVIIESLKIHLAKNLQQTYSKEFCSDFLSIAQIEPDNQAEVILLKLQEKIAGLYREEQLIAFESLMHNAYQGKHLTVASCKIFENWLQRERKEMENTPVVERRLRKVFYGLCYYRNGKIKNYCNGEKSRVYEKRESLMLQGYSVSSIFEKTYWHNGELSVQTIKELFVKELLAVFDDTYFLYLNDIKQIPAVVNKLKFTELENKYQTENNEIKKVLKLYRLHWAI